MRLGGIGFLLCPGEKADPPQMSLYYMHSKNKVRAQVFNFNNTQINMPNMLTLNITLNFCLAYY